MRFSLKWMLAVVAFVGLASGALYNANRTWAIAAHLLIVVALLAAILAATYLQPRAFYVGMCVFGCGYLLLTYMPQRGELGEFDFRQATTEFLDTLHSSISRTVVDSNSVPPPSNPFASRRSDMSVSLTIKFPQPGHFRTVGHALLVFVFALVGGVIGVWFSRRARAVNRASAS